MTERSSWPPARSPDGGSIPPDGETAPGPDPGSPPGAGSVAAGPGPRPPRRLFGIELRRLLVPGLVAGIVVALSLAGVFLALWLTSEPTPEETVNDVGTYLESNRATVARRTTEMITALVNYDPTTLERRSETILDLATGKFQEDYKEIIAGGLGQALEDAAASGRGEVLGEPEVAFSSPSQAIAIASVRATTQSSDNPEGLTIIYFLKVTMIDTADGGWKADQVEILSGEEA